MKAILLICFALPLAAQSNPEDFRFELTTLAWRTSVEGTVVSGGQPVELDRDVDLRPRFTFFGKLVAKPARHHRIFIDGSPYSFSGRSQLTRSIEYNGQTYNLEDTVVSRAELAYISAGYQYDLVSQPSGHFGLLVGGAWLNALGTISSETTGLSATRTQQLGLPLAGAEFRAFLVPSVLSISGEVKGMVLGGYGHFVQGSMRVGFGWRSLSLEAGYQVVDADIHENGGNQAGIAPRITGPVLGIQIRR